MDQKTPGSQFTLKNHRMCTLLTARRNTSQRCTAEGPKRHLCTCALVTLEGTSTGLGATVCTHHRPGARGTPYKRCGTPKITFSTGPIIIWLLFQGFEKTGKRLPKVGGVRDIILPKTQKRTGNGRFVLFPRGSVQRCSRVLRGFWETPTKCACHTPGPVSGPRFNVTNSLKWTEPRLQHPGSGKTRPRTSSPFGHRMHQVSRCTAHPGPETRPGTQGTSGVVPARVPGNIPYLRLCGRRRRL